MPQPVPTAEKIFAATQPELTAQAQTVVGDSPILAAGAFWPNGVTKEMMEGGTLHGHKLGAVFGPSLNQAFAMWGVFAGHDVDLDQYAMAKPIIVAVTEGQVHLVEPAVGDDAPKLFMTFERATTRVTVKRRVLSRILLLDDDAAEHRFRLVGSVAPTAKRSGPEKAVIAELTTRA